MTDGGKMESNCRMKIFNRLSKNSQAHPEKAVDALISNQADGLHSENRTAIAVKKQQLPKSDRSCESQRWCESD